METPTLEQTQTVDPNTTKYRPRMNGVVLPETREAGNWSNLEKFLEDEKNINVNDSWCKLNKTVKTRKMADFVQAYKEEHDLTNEEADLLTAFLRDCLDRKKLQRVKDVLYDKETGTIKDIPALVFLKTSKHFTLKNMDTKRVSTLKSLAPKKVAGKSTFRKKDDKAVDIDSEEECEA